LQPSGLRDAYKKAAMQNHPDRAVLHSVPEIILAQRFKRVKDSYELLNNYLEKREKVTKKSMVSAKLWPSYFFKWFKN